MTTIHRLETLSSNGADYLARYVGNATPQALAHFESRGAPFLCDMREVDTIPGNLVAPRGALDILAQADTRGLMWDLSGRVGYPNIWVDLAVYPPGGTDRPMFCVAWCDGKVKARRRTAIRPSQRLAGDSPRWTPSTHDRAPGIRSRGLSALGVRRHLENPQRSEVTSHSGGSMPTNRKPLAQRADERRAAQATDTRVVALETELAAARQREQMYRTGWRAASAARDQARGEALVYRRAARRRYLAMLRIAQWSRRGHDQARAARSLVMRYRERWNEALVDGERFRAERDDARRTLTEAVIDRDLTREDLDRACRELAATQRAKAENDERFQLEAARAREELQALTEHIRQDTERTRAVNDRLREFIAGWRETNRG